MAKYYYNECPFCGCNLDPGEACDCQKEKDECEEVTNES